MTNTYFKTSFENAKHFFFNGDHHSAYGELMHPYPGFFAIIETPGRCYHLVCYVDEPSQNIWIETSCEIHCAPEYRGQLLEYASSVIAGKKVRNLRIRKSGHVFMHAEHSFASAPITADVLKEMVSSSITVLSLYQDNFDKLAHGRLPDFGNVEEKFSEMMDKALGRKKAVLNDTGIDAPHADKDADCPELDSPEFRDRMDQLLRDIDKRIAELEEDDMLEDDNPEVSAEFIEMFADAVEDMHNIADND